MRPTTKLLSGVAQRAFALAAAAAAFWLGGCMSPGMVDPARLGPFHTPTNYAGDKQLPAAFRRVVLLPIAGGNIATAETAAALQPVFLAELQKQNRFEVVALTREACLQRFRVEELSSVAALPADFVGQLKREFAADGVLFVDLTAYRPYRPLAIGVRAKLATTEWDAHLLWTFDNVFSAADPSVANSARRHFLDADHRGVPADFTQAVLQSPSRFATYVAAEMFATLPRVYTPPPPAPRK